MSDINSISDELEKSTEEAQRQDPGSLRNSPIPTIVDIKSRLFSTEEQINEYLNSGKITEDQINKIIQMAEDILIKYLKNIQI